MTLALSLRISTCSPFPTTNAKLSHQWFILNVQEYLIWDSEIKGFGCRIYPSGIKTYVFFYRHPQTRKKIGLKIGKHGNVTPDVAREIAQGWAGDVARGIDPKDQQKEEGKDSKNIYFQQFLDIFTERYRKIYHKKRTFKEQTYLIDNHLLPFFKNTSIFLTNLVDWFEILTDKTSLASDERTKLYIYKSCVLCK